jgi:hypothetical protein
MKSKENKAERVLVHLRMRPISEDEKQRDKINPIETFDTDNNFITVKKDYEKKTFFFDNLLEPNIAQVEVFEKTGKSVVDSVIKGYNGTIFAYGQTGTGKTFTMVGNFQEEANRGIIPRSFEYLLRSTKQDKEFKYNISISFIQIYLETIMDLLEPSNENIRIREDPDLGVYLEGVEWVKVTNLQECHLVFEAGEKNRTTASTKYT